MKHVDLLRNLQLRIRKNEQGKPEVWDMLRKKWLNFSPEEHVRQALIHHLVLQCNYPPGLIAVERQISYGAMKKRFDIVVFGQDRKPWLLAECKAPDVSLNDVALRQLLQYHHTLSCPFWVLSNGHEHFCADARALPNVHWLDHFPEFPGSGQSY
jgi:hypothetical protein